MWRLGRGLRSFADGLKPPKAQKEVSVVSGSMLSSAELETAFTNPSNLTYAQINEIKYDETVYGCESALFRTRLRTGWSIEPPQDDPNDECGMAADVEWMLDRMGGTFRKSIETIARTAYRYGHSETERVLVTPDGKPAVYDSPFGQRLVFHALKTRDPETFRYYTDTHGNVTKLVQLVNGAESALDPDSFILFAWQPEFGNPYGNTAYRPIFRPWFGKKWTIKFLNNYNERKAGGILILKAKAGYDPDAHKTEAETFLRGIQSDSEAILPDELWELEINEPSGQGAATFKNTIMMYSLQIATGLLAPEHLGYTETEGGSYAKADVQQGLWFGVVEDLGAEIEAIVNEQIIPLYIPMNYADGSYDHLPRFKFKPLVEEDKWALFDAVTKAVQAGSFDMTDADREWLRKKIGAPELPDDFKTRGTVTSPGGGEGGEQGGGTDTGGKGGDEGADGEPAAESPQFSTFPRDLFASRSFKRPFTRYERHVAFADIRDRADSLEESTVTTVATIMDDAVTDWLARTEKIVKLGDKAKGRRKVRTLRLKGESEIKQTIRAALIVSRLFGKKDVLEETRRGTGEKFSTHTEFADASSLYMIPKAARKYLRGLKISPAALASIGEEAFYITGVLSDDVLKKVKGILYNALKHGDDARARKEIREALQAYVSQTGPYGGQVVDDVVLTPHRIQTIARTNLAKAYNAGRMEQMRDPDVDQVIVAYQWSAILDDSTTDYCAAMDRRVFDKDEIAEPPAHHQCRSVLIPVFRGETYEKTTQADVRDELRKASAKDRKVRWREQPINPDRIVRAQGFGG